MEDLLTKEKTHIQGSYLTEEEHPLWQELVRVIGPNFHNYPLCVDFHLQSLKYLKEYREKYS